MQRHWKAMPNTDIRLIPAYNQIESGTLHLLSVDIFDTLLWRFVPKPADLFLILGKKLEKEGWLVPGVRAENFAYLRSMSEVMTHQKKKIAKAENTEVTLEEIYWICNGIFRKISIDEMIKGVKGIINESDVQELVSMEIALEKELTAYDWNILNLIQYAVQHQVKVILVSDTYFTLTQLHEILDRPKIGLLPHVAKIFPSCEYGCRKHAGLFSKVLNDLQILPQTVLHIGDNHVSDCLGAQSAGIASIHYEKYDVPFREVMKREWPEENVAKRFMQLDPQYGDFGLTALRSRAIHSTELLNLKKSEQFFWKYGASILGPVLTGFTHWLYTRCESLKTPRVFCLMREGRLYANLLKQYAPFYPQFKIQAEELWLSRILMMRACVFYGTEIELQSLLQIHSFSPYTVESFAKALGLDINQFGRLKKYRHLYLKAELHGELLWYISHTPSIRNTVITHAAGLRQRILRYLSRFLDLSTTQEITLVDIGWTGTIQGALQALLTFSGYKISVQGLYLGTSLRSYYALMQGMLREGYLIQGGFPKEMENGIRGGLYILEQTATAGLNTLQDIDDNGEIVHEKMKIPKSQFRQAEMIRKGIEFFLNYFGQHLQQEIIHLDPSSDAFKEQLRNILIRALSFPTSQEAHRLGNWSHDHRSEIKKIHPLGHDPYYEKYIKDMLPAGMSKDLNMAWPAAYAAKQDKYGTLAAQAVRTGLLPVECFLSQDTIPLRIFLDTGKGFLKKAHRHIDMRSNTNRAFYSFVRLTSSKGPIRQLRIELPKSCVQMKSLRLTTFSYKSPNPKTLIFFENGESAEMPLVYSFENEEVYSVQIRLVCKKYGE